MTEQRMPARQLQNISEANKTIVGKHQASIEGGLTNNLKWKFIDLGFTFTYSLGGDAF